MSVQSSTAETPTRSIDPDNPIAKGLDIDFPTPDAYPESDIVIFDGKCLFCQSQLKKLIWWDGKNRFSFVSLHDEYVARHFPELSFDDMMSQMYAVERPTGKKHGGAKAVRYFTRKLPKLWWAMPFLHLPFSLPVWSWIYRAIAKRRYRLSQKIADRCEGGTCELHFGDANSDK